MFMVQEEENKMKESNKEKPKKEKKKKGRKSLKEKKEKMNKCENINLLLSWRRVLDESDKQTVGGRESHLKGWNKKAPKMRNRKQGEDETEKHT